MFVSRKEILPTNTSRGKWYFLVFLLCGDIEMNPGPNTFNYPFQGIRGSKLFHQNMRGLESKLTNISTLLLQDNNIGIFSLSETHIQPSTDEDIFKIKGFTFISNPREEGRGGGYLIKSHGKEGKILRMICWNLYGSRFLLRNENLFYL